MEEKKKSIHNSDAHLATQAPPLRSCLSCSGREAALKCADNWGVSQVTGTGEEALSVLSQPTSCCDNVSDLGGGQHRATARGGDWGVGGEQRGKKKHDPKAQGLEKEKWLTQLIMRIHLFHLWLILKKKPRKKQINKQIIIYTNKCIKMYRNSLQNSKLISINTLCDIT